MYKIVTFGAPQGFENGFITEGKFATLHNKSEPVVNALMSLLLYKLQIQKFKKQNRQKELHSSWNKKP